jgi:hypothetical protein
MEHRHSIEQATCAECGLRMEAHLKESGFENVLTDSAPKCRHEKGAAVLKCPNLKLAILLAHQSLRKL